MLEEQCARAGVVPGIRRILQPCLHVGIAILDRQERARRQDTDGRRVDLVGRQRNRYARLRPDIHEVHLFRRRRDTKDFRAPPVVAALIRVRVLRGAHQLVGAGADRRIIGKRDRVFDAVPDVLRLDGDAAPHRHARERLAHQVQAGVRLGQRELDRQVVHLLDVGHGLVGLIGPGHARVVAQHGVGEDHIVGGEGLPVAPLDAVAQRHRDLSEVVVVLVARRQPGNIVAGLHVQIEQILVHRGAKARARAVKAGSIDVIVVGAGKRFGNGNVERCRSLAVRRRRCRSAGGTGLATWRHCLAAAGDKDHGRQEQHNPNLVQQLIHTDPSVTKV